MPETSGLNLDRLHVIALQEDEFRTRARENRDVDRPPAEKVRIDEIDALLETGEVGRISTWLLRKERSDLEEIYHGSTYVRSEQRAADNDRAYQQFKRDFPDADENLLLTSPGRRAEYYDERAERIGAWAALLYDRPLSDDLKKAHSQVHLKPRHLVRMEDEAAAANRRAKQLENTRGHSFWLRVEIALDSSHSTDTAEVEKLLKEANDPDFDKSWDALKGELTSKSNELDDFHDRLIQEVRIPALRRKAAETQAILDDVRRAVGIPTTSEEPAKTAS